MSGKTDQDIYRIGIIDIGSNSVRLVVYVAPMRIPVPVFNEKVQCQLGRGLSETGHLSPTGIESAISTIKWFTHLASAMGVRELELVATSAVREASDGKDFVDLVKKESGHKVRILSGDEEARAAALGITSGVPDADGILGDLGGGSLDLVEINKGKIGKQGTLLLGHLRLMEDSNKSPVEALGVASERMESIPWIGHMEGRNLYAVGGSMRAIAKILVEQTGYPLHVIDNYKIRTPDALRMTRMIAGAGPNTLMSFPGVTQKQTETLPYAATVLGVLLDKGRPKNLIFSGFSMREGCLLEKLPEDIRKHDPLISGCMSLANRTSRFAINDRELVEWMDPLFTDESAFHKRLRHAACLISDLGWAEHPDYRAEHAFYRVLRLPFAGLNHPERVFLAISVLVRYDGDPDSILVAPLRNLLDDESFKQATRLGLSLRLAYTLSGGAPGLLDGSFVSIQGKYVKLTLASLHGAQSSEIVERRLEALANSFGLKVL
ncbi:MAG: exopolyphosphatase [Rhodospirillales bacterium]|nr:exopolyphosphatase [Rhodospirillales bacterium]